MSLDLARGLCLLACLVGSIACDPVRSADAGVPAPPAPAEQPDPEPVEPEAPVEPTVEDAAAPPTPTGFLGVDETATRASLANAPITRVRRGLGGRTLAFRVTLEDGSRGYYKPEQTFSAAHWYSEVAAYYLDRELGFGRVPPVVGRRMPFERLRRVAEEDERLPELIVAEDGTVRGALIGWVEGGLRPWALGQGWETHIRVQGGLAITPYQRPSDYRHMVNGEATLADTELGTFAPAPEELDDRARGELSDLIVFDFLISNVDRWGSAYTNVRRRRIDGELVFLDNGAGFWPNPRLGLMDARLEALQVFRRDTVDRLRAYDAERFRARLAQDPLDPVLSESRIDGIGERVEAVIEHVDGLLARFGANVVLLD